MPRSFSHLPAHAPGTSGQPLASLPSHRSLLGDDDLDSLLAPVISPGSGLTPDSFLHCPSLPESRESHLEWPTQLEAQPGCCSCCHDGDGLLHTVCGLSRGFWESEGFPRDPCY